MEIDRWFWLTLKSNWLDTFLCHKWGAGPGVGSANGGISCWKLERVGSQHRFLHPDRERTWFLSHIDAILKACLVPPLPPPALIGRHQTLCVCKRDTQGQWAGANQPWQLAATALSICWSQNWLRIEAVGVSWASATLSTDVSQDLGIQEVHNQLSVFIQKISNVGVQTLPEFQKHLLIYDASSLMDRLRYVMSCHGVAKSGVPALRVQISCGS
jgi:hypothetical protein